MIGNSVWNSMVQLVFNMYILDDDVDVDELAGPAGLPGNEF